MTGGGLPGNQPARREPPPKPKPSPQSHLAPKDPKSTAPVGPKARPLAETLAFLELSSRLTNNHPWIKEHLKTIDRTKLSKKLLKEISKTDQNLLLSTNRPGKVYAT